MRLPDESGHYQRIKSRDNQREQKQSPRPGRRESQRGTGKPGARFPGLARRWHSSRLRAASLAKALTPTKPPHTAGTAAAIPGVPLSRRAGRPAKAPWRGPDSHSHIVRVPALSSRKPKCPWTPLPAIICRTSARVAQHTDGPYWTASEHQTNFLMICTWILNSPFPLTLGASAALDAACTAGIILPLAPVSKNERPIKHWPADRRARRTQQIAG